MTLGVEPPSTDDGRREGGFALVMVLWIFIMLFAIGAEFAQSMRQDAQGAKNFADETQSYYLATAAANLAFFHAFRARDEGCLGEAKSDVPEGAECTPFPPVFDEWWSELMWGAPVWIRISDEDSKIPINKIDFPILRRIFGNLGLGPDDADAVANAILDWRDADDETRLNGAESDFYLSLPRRYLAKNSRLDSLEELMQIRGITPEMFYGSEDFPIPLRDVFTVYGKQRKVNVNNASDEVLGALFSFDEAQLAQVRSLRDAGPEGLVEFLQAQAGGDPGLAKMLVNDASPRILRVEVQAKLPAARVAAHLAAVIDIQDSSEGVKVLRWMDRLPAAAVPAA